MAIQGVVTSRDVLLHATVIVSCFGVRVFLRCCQAIVRGERTTFLACTLVRAPARVDQRRAGGARRR